MSYTKANEVLPHSLLRAVQQYIDGATLYIPRKAESRLTWGARTRTRETLQARNREILAKRRAGCSVAELAEEYFLSTKAVYKILNNSKHG